MNRRILRPVFETCKAAGCDQTRRRSEDFCMACFTRLPGEHRRAIASARSEQRHLDRSNAVLAAKTWLHRHPSGSVIEDVAREQAAERSRWWDRD